MGYDVKQLYGNAGHKMSDIFPDGFWEKLGSAAAARIDDNAEREIWKRAKTLSLDDILGGGEERGGLETAPVAGQETRRQRRISDSELLEWGAQQAMERGMNARAEKMRQEAMKRREFEETQALAREKMQWDMAEKNKQELLGRYDKATLTVRAILDAPLPAGMDPASEDGMNYIRERNEIVSEYMDSAQAVAGLAKAAGLPPEYFVDESVTSLFSGKDILPNERIGSLAKDFYSGWENNPENEGKVPTRADVYMWLKKANPGLEISSGMQKRIAEHAQGYHDAVRQGLVESFEDYIRNFTKGENSKAAKRTQAATDAALRQESDVIADRDTLRQFVFSPSSQSYSEKNAIELARYDGDFKQNLEEVTGKSLSAMIASGIGNIFNDKKTRLAADYNAAVKKNKNKLSAGSGAKKGEVKTEGHNVSF